MDEANVFTGDDHRSYAGRDLVMTLVFWDGMRDELTQQQQSNRCSISRDISVLALLYNLKNQGALSVIEVI